MFAMVGIWASVLIVGFRKYVRLHDVRTKSLGRYMLATWVAIGAAQCVTSFFHTELLATMIWTVGGILLNLDKIANSESEFFLTRFRGVYE
jgi:hypothetical protein